MDEDVQRVLTQLKNESGEDIGTAIDVPLDVTVDKLQLIVNAIQKQDTKEEETTPFSFFINDLEITSSLGKIFDQNPTLSSQTESIFNIICVPQAVYRVKSVTRCSSSIPGHAEPVISVSFNHDGTRLASGSGDTSVRFWDVQTETPSFTCQGHSHWVLCISWSPNGAKLASGDKNGNVIIWNPKTGKQIGKTLTGHKQWITSLAWEPFHLDPQSRKLASCGKDGTIRIWDTILGHNLLILSSHTSAVTCVKWGGSGLIYSSSQDRTIRVWRSADGVLCRILEGHGHWVNVLALSTDYVIRTSFYDPDKAKKQIHNQDNNLLNQDNNQDSGDEFCDKDKLEIAKKRYGDAIKITDGNERLVSGSDDFTLYLWSPEVSKKSISRMTGHQQLINDVKFSPDSRLIASASFDKSIKLWDSKTGNFICTLRGHVQAVYQISFSSDSRLIVSGSADSTLKVFDVKKQKLMFDLPGHADQVFAVDWSPDGEKVVSGGKDKVLKIWRR